MNKPSPGASGTGSKETTGLRGWYERKAGVLSQACGLGDRTSKAVPALITGTHFSFGLALAIVLALVGAPSTGGIYGPLFSGQQTVSNYFRTWIYASTTYFTYSKPTAGRGISTAAFSLAGIILAGWVGLEIMWATPLTLASRTYLIVTISAVVFCVLCSPKLFGLPSDIANNFSSTLMSVASWSIAKGTRSLATAASITLVVGTGLGIIMAFLVGALLFPRTATSKFMSKARADLEQLGRHLSITLRLTSAALNPDMAAATFAEMSLPDGSIPSDDPMQSSSVEEGADAAASRYLQVSQHMHAELWKYLEGRNNITELLSASQHEMYVRLWAGSFVVLPCWPCRCSSIPEKRFTAMQDAASTVVIATSTLADTFKREALVKMFGNLGKKGLPVESVSRITELIFSSTNDLLTAFPTSMAPGTVILPKGDNIWSLLEKVTQLIDQENKNRATMLYRKAKGRQGGSLEEHFGWLALLNTIETITTGLVRLRVVLCALLVELPWFDGGVTAATEDRAKGAILSAAELLECIEGRETALEDAYALMAAMEASPNDSSDDKEVGKGGQHPAAHRNKREDGGGFGGLAASGEDEEVTGTIKTGAAEGT